MSQWIRSRISPLATLPSKQGLKQDMPPRTSYDECPLATLPSKQGLKLDLAEHILDGRVKPLATLPSKQGLKPTGVHPRHCLPSNTSCYTSIKTRIETRRRAVRRCNGVAASCYTSIKTRIETWRQMPTAPDY